MSYTVALSESVFPAQADGVVRDLSLGDHRGYPRGDSIDITTDERVLQRTNTSIRLRILA